MNMGVIFMLFYLGREIGVTGLYWVILGLEAVNVLLDAILRVLESK